MSSRARPRKRTPCAALSASPATIEFMNALQHFCKAYERLLLLLLLCVAAGFYSLHITTPLYDFDEAQYAHVTVDTLESGNILHLTLLGQPWFHKPPLYYWLSMASVTIFGEKEYAFRLPGIIASITCLFLVYLITRELTGDVLSATIAFLVLLFTPLFSTFATQGQLDSSVVMCMLAILYFWIRGQSRDTYYLLLFPLAAVGFLYKSVIIFLAAPVVFIFSACYSQWSWLKNKYLWLGVIPALLLIAPWHILQTMRYGFEFWQTYLLWNVFERATSNITGTSDHFDYLTGIFSSSPWWAGILLAFVAIYTGLCVRVKDKSESLPYQHMLAPLGAALFILGLFSVTKTHLPFYILPIFPFVALFIGMQFHSLTRMHAITAYSATLLVSALIAAGAYAFTTPAFQVPHWSVRDEAAAGKIYRELKKQEPLYAIGWPNLDTLNYYGDTRTIYTEPELTPQALIRGPFYAVMATANLPIIFYKDQNDEWKCKYGDVKILYQGSELMLVYSSGDYPQL